MTFILLFCRILKYSEHVYVCNISICFFLNNVYRYHFSLPGNLDSYHSIINIWQGSVDNSKYARRRIIVFLYVDGISGGICGWLVRVVKLESLDPHRCRLESHHGREFLWWRYPTSLRNFDGSSQAPARARNNVVNEDSLQMVKLETRYMTLNVLVWLKHHPNKHANNINLMSKVGNV